MTCAEFKELAAGFALGALDPEERKACEEHLSHVSHEGCREAVADAQEVCDALGQALPPVKPGAHVWDGIVERLGAAAAGERSPARRGAVWRLLPWTIAAAAAVALIFAVLDRDAIMRRLGDAERANAQLSRQNELRAACQRDLERVQGELRARDEALALVELPGTRLVALSPPKGAAPHRATAIVNLERRKASVITAGLVAQPGSEYALWVIKGEDKRLAGTLTGEAGATRIVPVDPKLLEGGADAFAITLEPGRAGAEPRGPILLVGAIRKG